jgi:Vitamin K-dependent gamma-carboxylase
LLFGCYFLIYFLGGLNDISLFYSNIGVYCPVLIPDVAPSPAVAVILYSITVVLILALIAGYRVRVVGRVLLIFYLYHFCLNILVRACSYDRLTMMALIFLCLAPSDQVLSVTARKQQTGIEPTVSAWPAKLLALHICLFYLSTGVYKLLSPDWHTGEIMKGVMSSIFSSNLAFAVVGLKLPSFLFDIMAVSVIIFELSCPLGFLIRDVNIKLAFLQTAIQLRRVQYYFFLSGILFHTGIWIFMQIPQFFICPVYYVLFMPAGDIRHLVRRVEERFSRVGYAVAQSLASRLGIETGQGVFDHE